MQVKFIGYVFRWWFKSKANGQEAYLSYATAFGMKDAAHPDVAGTPCKDGLVVNAVDESECSVTLPNFDNTLSAVSLNNRLQGSRCEIAVLEIINGTEQENVIFKGMIDEVPRIDNRLELRAVAYAGLAHAPHKYIAAPLFNHLTPADVLVQFGEIEYKIQQRRT